MRRVVLVAAMILIAAPTLAQEHLEPERSMLSGDYEAAEYYSDVVSVLHDAYDRSVVARMLVLPSFRPEYVVGLRQSQGGYQIFVLRAADQLWAYNGLRDLESREPESLVEIEKKELSDLRSRLPEKPSDVGVQTCYEDIDSTRVGRILPLWRKMLQETGFPKSDEERVISSDGIDYHFSGIEYGLAGRTQGFGTNPGLLVQIGLTLSDICEQKNPEGLKKLDGLVSTLSRRLH